MIPDQKNSKIEPNIEGTWTIIPCTYFNSTGDWIATQVDSDVFSADLTWIGWVPEGEKVVYSGDNQYLGTIVHQNRLYYFEDRPCLRPTYPLISPRPCVSYPEFQGRIDPEDPPTGASDIGL